MSEFTSFQHFLHMGGYAAYVWPAYGVFIAVLVGQVIKHYLTK